MYALGFFSMALFYLTYGDFLLFPPDWVLQDKTIYDFWREEYLQQLEYIKGYFNYYQDANKFIQSLYTGAVLKVLMFLFGFIFFLIPSLFIIYNQAIKPVVNKLINHLMKKNKPTTDIEGVENKMQFTVIKAFFHQGAELIDKGSKWAIIISLGLYLVFDREQKLIEQSWDTILKFEGRYGDQGRKKAVENLLNFDLDIVDTNLDKSILERGDFSMRSSWFSGNTRSNFSLSKFSNSNLRQAKFNCAIARESNFTNAKLQGTDFSSSDLRGAIFNGTEYGSVDGFHFTDFSYADLRGAKFIDRKDKKTEIYSNHQQVIVDHAWLIGADIRGATIGNDIIGLTPEFLNEIKNSLIPNYNPIYGLMLSRWDETTIFPKEVEAVFKKLNIRDGKIENMEGYDVLKRDTYKIYKRTNSIDQHGKLQKLAAQMEISTLANSILGELDNTYQSLTQQTSQTLQLCME